MIKNQQPNTSPLLNSEINSGRLNHQAFITNKKQQFYLSAHSDQPYSWSMVLQKIRNENGMNLKIRENSYMKFICSLSFFGKMTFKKPPSKTHQLGKHTAAVPESTTPCGEQACHNVRQEHSLQAPRCLGYDRGTEPF